MPSPASLIENLRFASLIRRLRRMEKEGIRAGDCQKVLLALEKVPLGRLDFSTNQVGVPVYLRAFETLPARVPVIGALVGLFADTHRDAMVARCLVRAKDQERWEALAAAAPLTLWPKDTAETYTLAQKVCGQTGWAGADVLLASSFGLPGCPGACHAALFARQTDPAGFDAWWEAAVRAGWQPSGTRPLFGGERIYGERLVPFMVDFLHDWDRGKLVLPVDEVARRMDALEQLGPCMQAPIGQSGKTPADWLEEHAPRSTPFARLKDARDARALAALPESLESTEIIRRRL